MENVTKEKWLDYKTIPAFLKAYLLYFPMHIWRCKKRFLLLFYLPRARHLQRQRLHWLEFIPRGSRCKRGGILILSNRRFQIATYLVKVAAGSVFSSSLCCHQSAPPARKGPGLFACKLLLHRNIAACSTYTTASIAKSLRAAATAGLIVKNNAILLAQCNNVLRRCLFVFFRPTTTRPQLGISGGSWTLER